MFPSSCSLWFDNLRWSNLLVLAMTVSSAAHAEERRVALLIGNSNYAVAALRNPSNDVRVMNEALRALGFQTQVVENANQLQMKSAIRDFGKMANRADVAFVYYSGHGTQTAGENYLIPVQAIIENEADYELEAVSANALLRQIAGANPSVALVVLDACRDNPLPALAKSSTKGLARMDAPTRTLIAFATRPNGTAADNGDYARVLAKQLRQPGAEILDVFRETTAEVLRLSSGKQEPRISEVSITDRIYLSGKPTQSTMPNTSLKPASEQNTGTVSAAQFETLSWQVAKGTDSVAGYESYLEQYSDGKYTIFARDALRRIRTEEQTRAENELRAWQSAEKAGTAQAFESFLRDWSKGPHAAMAQMKLTEVGGRKADSDKKPMIFSSTAAIKKAGAEFGKGNIENINQKQCHQTIFGEIRSGGSYVFSNLVKNETGKELFVNQLETRFESPIKNDETPKFVESELITNSHIFNPSEIGNVVFSNTYIVPAQNPDQRNNSIRIIYQTTFSMRENGRWSAGSVHSTCVELKIVNEAAL